MPVTYRGDFSILPSCHERESLGSGCPEHAAAIGQRFKGTRTDSDQQAITATAAVRSPGVAGASASPRRSSWDRYVNAGGESLLTSTFQRQLERPTLKFATALCAEQRKIDAVFRTACNDRALILMVLRWQRSNDDPNGHVIPTVR